jgi:pimeloyl-ACP methyl ester carboxylesterase
MTIPPRPFALLALLLLLPAVQAAPQRKIDLGQFNSCLHGRVLDYTHNHGADNRIWSQALCQRRDLYVYLPPCFDPALQYPILLYLHGFTQDETHFLENLVPLFDQAIVEGRLPPCLVACPDGSIPGKPAFFNSASFYVNTNAGAFEDYLIHDVWPFLLAHFPIRPEREAHVLIGASMGGTGAFNLAFHYPDQFRSIIGIFPAVNLRWTDCRGHYRGDFDPCCWGWRTRGKPHEVAGRFYGVISVRFKVLLTPLFGRGPQVIDGLARINPIELLDVCDVQPGMFDMYLGYGDRDQFNIDAQVESFAYRARQRGLTVAVDVEPGAKHDLAAGKLLFPRAVAWVAPLIAPYSPGRPSLPSSPVGPFPAEAAPVPAANPPQ